MSHRPVPATLTSLQVNAVHQLLDRVATRQRKDFGNIGSDIKPDGTLITECDRWSDEILVKGIGEIARSEGVLSEEGCQLVPNTPAYWIIDPLDGTTNFAAGIPHWAISVARFVNGKPEIGFLEVPALKQRLVAIQGKGVWLDGKPITSKSRLSSNSACVSLCSRSIRILQQKPNKPFPGKIRLRGVASLNIASVGMGQTVAAIEATPKIWDLAAAWLILSELNCPIKWLDKDPAKLQCGQDLAAVNFPLLTAGSQEELNHLLPWGDALIKE